MQRETHSVGTRVKVTGLMVGSATATGFFLLDAAGGRNGGVWVYLDGIPAPDLLEGDEVEVKGIYEEYTSGAGTLTEIKVSRPPDMSIGRRGVALPDPVVVEASVLADPGAGEPFEATLLQVRDVVVADANAGNGEWLIDDGVVVDDLFYAPAGLRDGLSLESLTGVLNYASGFKIEPRYTEDLVLGTSSRCNGTLCAEDLQPGDLVISEVMTNPAACDDNYCEWVEVYNASGQSVDLIGLTVRDASAREGLVDASVVIAARGYAVIGKSDAVSWAYPDMVPGAWYGGSVALVNDGQGTVAVVNPSTGAVVDQSAEWGGGTGNSSGVAWQLDPSRLDSSSNDEPGSWCDAQSVWGSTDRGSPGAANRPCP